ncbi:lipid-A-disaccharide synthase [Frigidibacter sp. RF13]|uniref:lipid-A-disaccharide synthase n=1 Tax=Frigidibacter sp. RF13 TaxID=2997340 RepID=UPI00226E90AE|nr:lipid-A-disaccharide synthase [Frigidibacter sp. RF13]MCY1125395.1 lipid-A-disaccharide synthase [Frigidibacter sp. RF13]
MKLFLTAGEASGDALGAALMAGLKALCPDVRFEGVGGPLMAAEGLDSLFPMEDLAVMGLLEVLPKYRFLKRRIAEAAAAVTAARPDALITIDSPDFSLRVAKLVREANPSQKTIHYVAPTVWAWRPGRAAKMAPLIDHVLALFPFEPPYMEAAGMTCDFVGHPVVSMPRATEAEASAFRESHSIDEDQPLLLCLPGSRRGEVTRLMPRFELALDRLQADHPGLRIAIPTVRGVAGVVGDRAARWQNPPLILTDAADKRAAFGAANLALAASGTVSLELAANRVPMVIAHDFNRLTWWMMKRAALIDTVTLVNIVSETRAVPEFLGPACRPGPIVDALARLLADPAARTAQLAAMEATMDRLGRGAEAPGLRAARSVLARLGGS